MSRENVDIVRRGYELNNALGRTGDAFVDPEEVAPEFWSRLAPDFELGIPKRELDRCYVPLGGLDVTAGVGVMDRLTGACAS